MIFQPTNKGGILTINYIAKWGGFVCEQTNNLTNNKISLLLNSSNDTFMISSFHERTSELDVRIEFIDGDGLINIVNIDVPMGTDVYETSHFDNVINFHITKVLVHNSTVNYDSNYNYIF